jgi:Protein of unknown function (DUF3025)
MNSPFSEQLILQEKLPQSNQSWYPEVFNRQGVFQQLSNYANIFSQFKSWPSVMSWNNLIGKCAKSGAGLPIFFKVQKNLRHLCPQQLNKIENNYQLSIFFTGGVSSRERNWHDLFNAISYDQFPLIKESINRRHFWEHLKQTECNPTKMNQTTNNRTAVQDALTLLDEGGAIVVCKSKEMTEVLRVGNWEKILNMNELEMRQSFSIYLFGHAIFEVLLNGVPCPHISCIVLTNKSTEQNFPQKHKVDFIASYLLNSSKIISGTENLWPIPLLIFPSLSENWKNSKQFLVENKLKILRDRIRQTSWWNTDETIWNFKK